jgi:hypothetical protein
MAITIFSSHYETIVQQKESLGPSLDVCDKKAVVDCGLYL